VAPQAYKCFACVTAATWLARGGLHRLKSTCPDDTTSPLTAFRYPYASGKWKYKVDPWISTGVRETADLSAACRLLLATSFVLTVWYFCTLQSLEEEVLNGYCVAVSLAKWQRGCMGGVKGCTTHQSEIVHIIWKWMVNIPLITLHWRLVVVYQQT
jgi:hypothetical protein